MRIVAVTACSTGIAHTYLAAEKLEATAASLGHDIKVETQGAMGIERRLSDAEIASADVVILASDVQIEQRLRFSGKRIVEVAVQDALRHPADVLGKASTT